MERPPPHSHLRHAPVPAPAAERRRLAAAAAAAAAARAASTEGADGTPAGHVSHAAHTTPAAHAPDRLLLRGVRLAMASARPDRARARQRLTALLDAQAPWNGAGTRVPAPPPPWTPGSLAGLLDAVQHHCMSLDGQAPVVVMASGGGARELPVLTPLLALWLAREGVRVLLHGPLTDPAGVTSAEVLRNLGVHPAAQAQDVAQAWSRREPACLATSTLCPALEPLLQRSHGAAWRHLAHRLLRLLQPVTSAPTLRVAHHGSHETSRLLAGWAEQVGASVMLLRGAEGEPVADLRRRPRIDTWLSGRHQPRHSCSAQGRHPAAPPLWPQQADAATTALYVQAVLSGERPAPAPLAAQVGLILDVMHKL